jgi:5-formyltetrahydrofolate cyclo-ligase
VLPNKAEIREFALKRRDALAPDERLDSGQIIINRILAKKEFRDAQTVLAYYGFGTEIDTMPLLLAVLEGRKRLLLPKVNRAAGVLDVYEVKNIDADLLAGLWGIREPNPELCAKPAAMDIDLAVVPGTAFDRQGGRIGYGKGYYDKLLGSLQQLNRYPRTVAGAFEVQVVDAIPMEPHDVAIDTLVTEAGEWKAGNGGGIGEHIIR